MAAENPAISRNWLRWFLISALVIVLDQLAKFWISQSLAPGEIVPLTPFFNLVLTYNAGAAFSFLSQASGWQRGFFIVVALAASFLITYLLRRHHQKRLFSLGLSLILGGAVGNLWDRIVLGQVMDFLDFYIQAYHWPAFNVADSAITCGAALLIWDSFSRHAAR
ncbi:MAG TPA: signal peptidase II [Burkholderiales bacterium]|nr:signal peptidase II [Burkholderiales bacterium]